MATIQDLNINRRRGSYFPCGRSTAALYKVLSICPKATGLEDVVVDIKHHFSLAGAFVAPSHLSEALLLQGATRLFLTTIPFQQYTKHIVLMLMQLRCLCSVTVSTRISNCLSGTPTTRGVLLVGLTRARPLTLPPPLRLGRAVSNWIACPLASRSEKRASSCA
jgi:hypothetical protein